MGFLALLALSFPLYVRAASSIYMPIERLAATVPLVVEGVVARTASGFDPATGALSTYVTVDVSVVHRGPADLARVIVREPGGRLGDLFHVVDAAPVFRPGERVLLFLEPARDGSLRVAGMFLGKLELVENAAGRSRTARRVLSTAGLTPELGVRETEDFPVEKIQSIVASVRYDSTAIAAAPKWLASPPELDRLRWDDMGEPPAADLALIDSVAVSIDVQTSGNPLGSAAAAVDAIRRGMEAWSNAPEARIAFQVGNESSAFVGANAESPAAAYPPVNIVLFDDPYGDISDPIECSGILAISGYWRSGLSTEAPNGATFHPPTRRYVIFNNGFQCFLGNADNLAEVAKHQLGHAVDSCLRCPDDASPAEDMSPVGRVTSPVTPEYLIGSPVANLIGAIVVGSTPGGVLGGTWASPTMDPNSIDASNLLPNSITAADAAPDMATQDEIDLKAPLASPALTGIPTVPTAPVETNTTQAASTAFVQAGFVPLDGMFNATQAIGTTFANTSKLSIAPADTFPGVNSPHSGAARYNEFHYQPTDDNDADGVNGNDTEFISMRGYNATDGTGGIHRQDTSEYAFFEQLTWGWTDVGPERKGEWFMTLVQPDGTQWKPWRWNFNHIDTNSQTADLTVYSSPSRIGMQIQSNGTASFGAGINLGKQVQIGGNGMLYLAGTSGGLVEFEGAAGGSLTRVGVVNPTSPRTINFPNASGTICVDTGSGCGGSDGDKGDVTVSLGGTVWAIDAGTIGPSQLSANSITAADAAPDMATQVEINAKADLASPALTGDPTVPTAPPGDDDASAASTAFVAASIAGSNATLMDLASPQTVTGAKTFSGAVTFLNPNLDFVSTSGTLHLRDRASDEPPAVIEANLHADPSESFRETSAFAFRARMDFSPESTESGYMVGFGMLKPVDPGAGSTVRELYGIFIDDLGFERDGILDGSAIYISAQSTPDGSRGNLRFEGGDYKNGHLMFGSGDTHLWSDSGVLRVRAGGPGGSTSDGNAVVTGTGSSSHGANFWGVMTATDPAFDTGMEVCAAQGLTCVSTTDTPGESIPCDKVHTTFDYWTAHCK